MRRGGEGREEEERRGGEAEVSGAYHIGKGRALVYISVAQELLQGCQTVSPAELHCHRTDSNPTGVHHPTGQDSRTLTPNTVASTQETAVM